MEKDYFMMNSRGINSPTQLMDILIGGHHEQFGNFLNLNRDNSMDQNAPFESALSSIVSSPVGSDSSSVPPPNSENAVIRELIGRLGSICISGEVSPHSGYINVNNGAGNVNNSTNNSCYSTPLNSPPKLNLSMMDHELRANSAPFPSDPGFTERAARLSDPDNNRRLPSRLSSSSTTPEKNNDGEFNSSNAQGDSSNSEQLGGNGRKRKSASKGKAKENPSIPSTKDVKITQVDNSDAKKSKSGENGDKTKADSGEGSRKNNGNDQKPPEPLKDYIHLRARRGQATDSHSLAERVRREKISERMKFLQDLVPGCKRVTGKAVMLDEIINYVQSLQRQVEFLSLKLSAVNPRLDFNMEALLSKDILQPRGPFAHPNYPIDASAVSTFPYGHQPSQHVQSLQQQQNGTTNGTQNHCPLDAALRRNLGMQLPPLDGFCESAAQLGAFWEDDLQSVVQMGFGQNQSQETGYHSQHSHGLPSTHMKVEL